VRGQARVEPDADAVRVLSERYKHFQLLYPALGGVLSGRSKGQ
jgi:hypothetical protein